MAGKLLVAMPGIGDPRFSRSVIMMCTHDAEHAMGVVINKPKQEVTLSEVLGHYVQHHVNIGASIADVHNVVRANLMLCLQLVERGHFAITRAGAHDGIDLPRVCVPKHSAKYVIGRNDSFEGRMNHFHGCCGQYVEIETVALNSVLEELVEQINIFFQTNLLAGLDEVLATHA